jgi:hypothetical protein
MTNGQIDKLSGRELDFAVAECAMNWQWYWWTVANSQEAVRGLFPPDYPNCYGYQLWSPEVGALRVSESGQVPYFSGSIEAAWAVVEALRKRGFGFDLFNVPEGWRAIIIRRDIKLGRRGERETVADAETAPLAICRAALAALRAVEERAINGPTPL